MSLGAFEMTKVLILFVMAMMGGTMFCMWLVSP